MVFIINLASVNWILSCLFIGEMEMRSSWPFPDCQCVCFYSDVLTIKQSNIFVSLFKVKWFKPYWVYTPLLIYLDFFFSEIWASFSELCQFDTSFETLWSMLHIIFWRRWHFRWICGNFLAVTAHWAIDVFYFLLFSLFIVN